MRDFRFGMAPLGWVGVICAPAAPVRLLGCGGDGQRRMDCAAHSAEQRSSTSVRRSCREQHTAESQGAGRKCLTRSSGETMVADTKSISAMHRSASKSTPATRPSRFLLRQILKPTRRNAVASRFSTFHGTCSVKRLAQLPGVRQGATSKTAGWTVASRVWFRPYARQSERDERGIVDHSFGGMSDRPAESNRKAWPPVPGP